jgi:plastocyanin
MSAVRRLAVLLFVGICGMQAAEVRGKVEITRRLTKKRITLPVAAYQRGVGTPLPQPEQDITAAELRRVAIYLEPSGAIPRPPVATAELGQKNRRFLEETVVIPVGSTVSFPNLDPIFHNVFSLSRARSFDLGNYPKDETRKLTFPQPGVVQVFCHLHPNMSAAIVVTPGPWGSTPDPDGTFEFDEVPPGAYTVVAWHRSAGYFRRQIRVSSDRGAEVKFMIPVEEGSGK